MARMGRFTEEMMRELMTDEPSSYNFRMEWSRRMTLGGLTEDFKRDILPKSGLPSSTVSRAIED